ncbi:MAG: flippase-like domain-containing protein [Gemmatimonadaceae bacterium]|nr:flippase-like domain-containing protein [Gemmatimonadaceae bacterium]
MSRRTVLVRVAQAVIALVIMGTAVHTLRGQWSEVRQVASTVRLGWTALGAASAIVLAAYLVLVAAWRHVVNAMGGTLRYADAAYVWFVSALARYAGALWQVVALSALAKQRGAPPVTAAGAAIVMTIVNILTGFGVVLATGAVAASALGTRAHVALAVGVAALIAAPVLAPRLQPVVSRLTGREAEIPVLTPGAVWVAAVGSVVSWLLYGVAFMLLTHAVLGTAPGGWLVYVSVYTTAYLAGLLGLVPAGVGVAEGAMVAAFAIAGILPPAEALTVAVVSRLWRTVLEIVPGLVLLATRPRSRT